MDRPRSPIRHGRLQPRNRRQAPRAGCRSTSLLRGYHARPAGGFRDSWSLARISCMACSNGIGVTAPESTSAQRRSISANSSSSSSIRTSTLSHNRCASSNRCSDGSAIAWEVRASKSMDKSPSDFSDEVAGVGHRALYYRNLFYHLSKLGLRGELDRFQRPHCHR